MRTEDVADSLIQGFWLFDVTTYRKEITFFDSNGRDGGAGPKVVHVDHCYLP
jgi:hypothetical protein